MQKVIKLLAVVVLALSIFCISAMAAGTDDAQMTFVVRDGVKYIGSNPAAWCTFYTATNGSGEVIYSYDNVDLNEDGNIDVCDLVKLDNDKFDFNFDGLFAASDADLLRVILFTPDKTYETHLNTVELQMKAEAEAVGAPYEKLGRQLVWHDEFNGKELNRETWDFELTMYSKDHQYVNDSNHVRVEDGNLHLQIHKSNKEGYAYSMPKGLTTTDSMLFKYGYLEMRAKAPYRKGAWPSFWCTSETPLQEAENRMEVDIMEIMGYTTGFSTNLHKWANDASKHIGKNVGHYAFADSSNLVNEYHTYGFEWDTETMSFYIDGYKYTTCEITGENAKFGSDILPEADMFQDWLKVIINNECFTENGSYKPVDGYVLSDKDPMPINYYIDYIRLYQNADKGEVFKTKNEIAAIVAEREANKK